MTKAAPVAPTLFRPDIERFFERLLGPSMFDAPDVKVFESVWAPSVDLAETDKEFVVRVEAPGVNRENMDVNLEGNVLTVTGRRESRKEGETEEYIWKEREEGKFMRSFRMPKPVAEGKVTATYEDGVLTIRLLKAEPTMKTRVTIK